jgi:hypothetical protein
VQTGPGHLADGVEPLHPGPTVEIGEHATAVVVRGRHHRDRIRRGIDTDLGAGLGDGREALGEPLDGRGVEPDVVRTGLAQMPEDGRRDHVARGQVAGRVDAVHHPGSGVIAQDPALPAHCLGHQRDLASRLPRHP